jgi:hypothetical protein
MSYGCLLKFKLRNVSRWQFGFRRALKIHSHPGVERALYLLDNNRAVREIARNVFDYYMVSWRLLFAQWCLNLNIYFARFYADRNYVRMC